MAEWQDWSINKLMAHIHAMDRRAAIGFRDGKFIMLTSLRVQRGATQESATAFSNENVEKLLIDVFQNLIEIEEIQFEDFDHNVAMYFRWNGVAFGVSRVINTRKHDAKETYKHNPTSDDLRLSGGLQSIDGTDGKGHYPYA